MKFILTSFFCIFYCSFLFSQADTVYLENPSFEGIPKEGDGGLKTQLPKGWYDCGFAGESPPGVHPVFGGSFQVGKPPSHGKTYIGMVTRDNDTWERIGGKLSSKLKKGQCYTFSIDLARSEIYTSYSRLNPEQSIQANYVQPIKLRIYGGTNRCDRAEMIGETSLIRNSRWLTYTFNFQPLEDYKYLTFEAFYHTPIPRPYNGNILMDNASELIIIACDEIAGIQKSSGTVSPEDLAKYENRQAELKAQGDMVRARKDSINRVKQEAKALVMADFNKLVALTKLTGKSINFNDQTANLATENFELADKIYNATSGLNEIFDLVKSNPKLSILIGVKKKDSKKTQAQRITKLEAMAKAAGLNEETVLVRKKNKIKWSYPWDAENGDLVFYIFEPEN